MSWTPKIGDRVTVVREWRPNVTRPDEVADGLSGTLVPGGIVHYPYRVDLDSPLSDERQRIYVHSVRELKEKDGPKLGLQQVVSERGPEWTWPNGVVAAAAPPKVTEPKVIVVDREMWDLIVLAVKSVGENGVHAVVAKAAKSLAEEDES